MAYVRNLYPNDENRKAVVSGLDEKFDQINFETHSVLIFTIQYSFCDFCYNSEYMWYGEVSERFYLDALAVQENRIIAVLSSLYDGNGYEHASLQYTCVLIVQKSDLPSESYEMRVCGYSRLNPEAGSCYHHPYEEIVSYWEKETK